MNFGGLRVTNFSASTAYVKLGRFTTQKIPELIKAVSRVSDSYEKVERIGDSGIKLSMEGEFNIDITREKFSYEETVKRSFQLVREDFVGLLTEVKNCLELSQIWGLTTTIQAVCPTEPKANVQEFLRMTAVPIKDDQIRQLCLKEFFGIGMRLYGKQDGVTYNIVVEPLITDPSQFFISVGSNEWEWFETPSVMKSKLDLTYKMLTVYIPNFINSFE